MHLSRSLLLLLAFAVLAAPAHATEKGMLGFAKFALKSDGIGESGPVEVIRTQADIGITSLSIHAFGKAFVLDPSQLSQLKGF